MHHIEIQRLFSFCVSGIWYPMYDIPISQHSTFRHVFSCSFGSVTRCNPRISPTKRPLEIDPEAPGPHATTRDCQGVAAEAVEVEPAQRGREPM